MPDTDLPALLTLAYPARHRINGDDSPTWDDAIATIAGAGIPRADIEAKRDALALVQDRCVVSRTQRELLDAVLPLIPA